MFTACSHLVVLPHAAECDWERSSSGGRGPGGDPGLGQPQPEPEGVGPDYEEVDELENHELVKEYTRDCCKDKQTEL